MAQKDPPILFQAETLQSEASKAELEAAPLRRFRAIPGREAGKTSGAEKEVRSDALLLATEAGTSEPAGNGPLRGR